jgi:hypothetical protein
MDADSTSGSPSEQPHQKFAEILGILIAVLTLTLPPFIIARYSGGSLEEFMPTTYPIGRVSE